MINQAQYQTTPVPNDPEFNPPASASASVLQNRHTAELQLDPYPYIIIRDALPEALCDRLIASYPSLEVLGADPGRNNVRWSFPASEVRKTDAISGDWKAAINYHLSRQFYDELIDLFGDAITTLYPGLFPDRESLLRLRIGNRGTYDISSGDIRLDAQISGNTPVSKASSVKPNHIDSHRKLFSGLLYLRRDEDDSTGGDLEIRRFKSYYTGRSRAKCYDGVYVDNRHTELVNTVRYEKNVLVLFINSLESLHGVTPRQPTPHQRIFMNLVGEISTPLFEVPRTASTRFKKLRRMVKKRAVRLMGGEYTDPYTGSY
jgi:hypothetical protein